MSDRGRLRRRRSLGWAALKTQYRAGESNGGRPDWTPSDQTSVVSNGGSNLGPRHRPLLLSGAAYDAAAAISGEILGFMAAMSTVFGLSNEEGI